MKVLIVFILTISVGVGSYFVTNAQLTKENSNITPKKSYTAPLEKVPEVNKPIVKEVPQPQEPTKELILEHELKVPNNIGTNNARRAAELINGYVLKPGEIFSYNTVVGERTKAKGFIEGTLHARDENGNVITMRSVGSGVCRTSTALYQAAKKAGLKIVERHSHEFEQPYAKKGDDATVWYGVLDNRFENIKDYPIQIECSVTKDCVIIVKFYKVD